jgi:hypothetical protein
LSSPHIFTQFNQLGATASSYLINKNVTSFEKILELSEQAVASIIGKNITFASKLIEAVKLLPKFEVTWNITNRKSIASKTNNAHAAYCDSTDETASIEVCCSLLNFEDLSENGGTLGAKNKMVVIIGDSNNNLVYYQRIK